MITYNGIELDYRADTLNSLIIKGGLTKIENLTDRTGTSSTQFDLPRTAKNELALGNITTEGAESSTFGEAYIPIDCNILSKGVLYVQGYDNDNFKCLFMGSDNDLIKTLKDLPLSAVFNPTQQLTYTDANIITALEAEVSGYLGQDITYHFGHPQTDILQAAGEFKFENIAPYFNLRSMIYKMFKDQDIDLTSNFLDSDYGESLDWSNFDGTHLSSNGYQNGSNSITSSASGYFNLGTALGNNNSVTPSTFIGSALKYTLDNNTSKVNIKGVLDFTNSEEIESVQVYVIMYRGASPIYSTLGVYNDGGLLQDGKNYFDITIERSFLANDFILFGYETKLKSGFSFPISGGSIDVDHMTISHDGIQVGDALHWANYASNENQYEFLKKFLVQFNLVLDVDGDKAYIELQDEGVEPVGSSPASLPSIADDTRDITNIVLNETATEVEYLKGDLVHLKQEITDNQYVNEQQIFPYQKIGSYLYQLNTFSNNRIEVYEGGFNTLFDYIDFSSVDFTLSGLDYSTTWDSYVSSRFGYFSEVYNETYAAMNFTKSDTTTQSVDALINWSRPVWFSRTWKYLFINTLNQKKNNKVIEVVFRDELGTIVSNRREYIYKDQVYKIIEWSYDIVSKLVKAKLIMK